MHVDPWQMDGIGGYRACSDDLLGLASDEARFVTGTEIIVDGGMTARCD